MAADCEHGYKAAGGSYFCPLCDSEKVRRFTVRACEDHGVQDCVVCGVFDVVEVVAVPDLLSDEAVERAARAMYERGIYRWVGNYVSGPAWSQIDRDTQDRYRDRARAALRAALGCDDGEQG
jgi:hypothetical protein